MSRAFSPSSSDLAQAMLEGTPAFLGRSVPESSPSRGSPYLVDSQTFYEAFANDSGRRQLLENLYKLRQDLEKLCEVHALLVGGSFVRTTVTLPRDCDVVIFYALRSNTDVSTSVEDMCRVAGQARTVGIDLRLVPVDTHPVDLIKAACYFSLLFAAERGGQLPKYGSVLVVDAVPPAQK